MGVSSSATKPHSPSSEASSSSGQEPLVSVKVAGVDAVLVGAGCSSAGLLVLSDDDIQLSEDLHPLTRVVKVSSAFATLSTLWIVAPS
jgi:hypothetical protein